MFKKDRSRKKYPSDLTDEPWAIVAPLIPPGKQTPRGGRPRQVEMRDVLNTLFSLHRSGCPWDRLPHAVLPTSPVSDSLAQWRDDGTWAQVGKALREQRRVAAGRAPTPSAAGIESQSVKPTEMGGPERGDDGGKQLNGRKRPLWVATLGCWLAVLIPRAGLDAGVAALTWLGHVTPHDCPRLVTICAAQQDHNQALDAWMAANRADWRLAVQTRPAGTQGCTPLEKRWVLERTTAWPGRYRRHSQASERRIESSTAMLPISHRPLLLHRLSPCSHPAFHDRKDAA
jgi:putative transposase